MTCLFREINGGFPLLLNFPILSPDLCVLKSGYHVDLLSQGLGEMAGGDVGANAAPSLADHLPNQWSLDPEIASKAIACHGGNEFLFGG